MLNYLNQNFSDLSVPMLVGLELAPCSMIIN